MSFLRPPLRGHRSWPDPSEKPGAFSIARSAFTPLPGFELLYSLPAQDHRVQPRCDVPNSAFSRVASPRVPRLGFFTPPADQHPRKLNPANACLWDRPDFPSLPARHPFSIQPNGSTFQVRYHSPDELLVEPLGTVLFILRGDHGVNQFFRIILALFSAGYAAAPQLPSG